MSDGMPMKPPPVATLLGARVVEIDLAAGELRVDYEALPSFRNPAGQVQGGMLAAMLDDLTASLVTASLAPGEACATLGLNVSYLAPGEVGVIAGRGWFERKGRSVCYVRGELAQGGKVIATASATCMIVRQR